jgi:hypothetical protein
MAITYVTGTHVALDFPERENLEKVFAQWTLRLNALPFHVIKFAWRAMS